MATATVRTTTAPRTVPKAEAVPREVKIELTLEEAATLRGLFGISQASNAFGDVYRMLRDVEGCHGSLAAFARERTIVNQSTRYLADHRHVSDDLTAAIAGLTRPV